MHPALLLASLLSAAPVGVVRLNDGAQDVFDAPRGARLGTLRGGLSLPLLAERKAWLEVMTPCERTVWVPAKSARREARVDVVLDPGHGGDELGAEGPTGLEEKDVNLAVAKAAVDGLRRAKLQAASTRESDFRATLTFRVALARGWTPKVLVSVHHNAMPDGPREAPGTETYYQLKSAESKRLAGLVYEEAVAALAKLDARWVGDTDAGAKYRPGASGDYYGILRRALEAKLPACLAELAFISNPTEEALLKTDAVRKLEGEAVARGVERFLRSKDAGSGFVEPYPRTEPAGAGGHAQGCVDPAE